jgi:hypothetical protein
VADARATAELSGRIAFTRESAQLCLKGSALAFGKKNNGFHVRKMAFTRRSAPGVYNTKNEKSIAYGEPSLDKRACSLNTAMMMVAIPNLSRPFRRA